MNETKKRHFPIVIEQDSDGVFIVECPSFVGCRSYGHTLDEAMDNIRDAIELCLSENEETVSDTTFVGVRDLELIT